MSRPAWPRWPDKPTTGTTKHDGTRATSHEYRITKAAQNMLSITMAQDLAEMHVEVWALHPGRLATKMRSVDADMHPDDAARRLVGWITERTPQTGRARFLTLDPRESPSDEIDW